jgi:hypothetical protein
MHPDDIPKTVITTPTPSVWPEECGNVDDGPGVGQTSLRPRLQ